LKNPQLNKHGELVHLLSIEGLPRSILTQVLDTAASFVSVNDLSVGRNPQEVLRVLDALQTDELCPCNWEKGQPTL
jgi:hypothetical protein